MGGATLTPILFLRHVLEGTTLGRKTPGLVDNRVHRRKLFLVFSDRTTTWPWPFQRDDGILLHKKECVIRRNNLSHGAKKIQDC